ncbi:MAG: hypothetical protein NVS3B12_31550 [Acidimicrobiales bacterium]
MRVRAALSAGAVLGGVVLSAIPLATPDPAAAASAPSVSLIGHGFGHGRGMSQYGSLGYAIDKGWTYHQILDHYYGGTTAGQAPPDSIMTVDMTSRDGQETIVSQERGGLVLTPSAGVACTSGSPCAVRIVRSGSATWQVYQGTACNGGTGWKLTSAALSAPAVIVTPTAGATDSRPDMLALCESSGTRWLRGDIWAADTGTSQASVNHVALDSYVRGVVPRESPASWGNLGGGSGEQALLVQAVAARSYALAENRSSYAKTCDTTSCQVYGGRAFQSFDGTYTDLEGTPTYATSDSAVSQTSGEIRVFTSTGGGAAGSAARTEFSSSTGGYSAGGTFPAVPDDGDATASNPNHTWTDSVLSSSIEQAYGSGKGSLSSVEVTGRNGLGDLGGRVTSMVLHFSGGDVRTTGPSFAGNLGLRSDWFAVTAQPSGPTTGPPQTEADPYHVLTADGTVYRFNGAPAYGSFGAIAAKTTAVSLAETPGGYEILGADGSVHPFGSASTYGSLAGKHLNAPPFQIWATPSGVGYWIVAFDGGVFSYGDAQFFGSTGNIRLNKPVVGMAPTPTGRGYWLVASDGGVFSYGDAQFFGSTGNIRLNKPVVAMTATRSGHGYWLIASDGGIFSFGDATYMGSLPGMGVDEPAVAVAARPGTGYVVATSPGHVYSFGPPGDSLGPADRGATSPTAAIGLAR